MTELYPKNCITLDGCMDEPVWENAREFTGFKKMGLDANPIGPEHETFFKLLTFADRIYVGIKCMDPDMERVKSGFSGSHDNTDGVELFLSPSGNPFDFYQFFVSAKGDMIPCYYEEEGNIKPDRYAPEWRAAVFYGENAWSVEIELPLTAFYMTAQSRWSDTWLVNVSRTHLGKYYLSNGQRFYSTWATLHRGFLDPKRFLPVDGFPIRDPRNDVCISSVLAEITQQKGNAYLGKLKVLVKNACAGKFMFASNYSESAEIDLDAGINEFSVPCCFDELTRFSVRVTLKRLADGVEFKRAYPVNVTYEPIVIQFTAPEYRTNFYPGQDHTRIAGKAIAEKSVTLTLEGPGIPKQTLIAEADGSFVFETPDFENGDAILTAVIDGYETTRRIRNLPPTGHMMTWISGGNLIVNGKPVLRRNMYAEYYAGGEAFKRKYDADNLHITKEICGQLGWLEPGRLIKGSEGASGEAAKDARPTPEMLRLIDETLEKNKDRDFAYYYLTDEPECRGLSKIYFQHLYRYITEKDPYHVVLTASRNAGEMVDIADWFETHPYINPYTDEHGNRIYSRQISTLGKFVDDIVKLDRPDKCIGFLSTCYAAMKNYAEPYITFDEYICHTWAAMIRGGKTLWPYAYHDLNDRASLYEGTRYIFSSFEALDQIILHGKRMTLLKTPEAEAVLYEHGEEKMFVLVNLTNQPQQVTLPGITGTWHAFRHNEMIEGNAFALKPLEVIIGTSAAKDAGLPTYKDTAALIDKLEYQRTHRGSLLFERQKEITITSSGTTGAFKMFDGVLDNFAWAQDGDKEKFFELDLTKIRPTIRKIAVHGWHIDNMELKVRNGGELTAVKAKQVDTEEFSKTYILEEPICPDALRLEFDARRVELYEIEAF